VKLFRTAKASNHLKLGNPGAAVIDPSSKANWAAFFYILLNTSSESPASFHDTDGGTIATCREAA